LGREPEAAVGEAAVQQDDRHAARARRIGTPQTCDRQLDTGIGAVAGLEKIDVLAQVAAQFGAEQSDGKESAAASHYGFNRVDMKRGGPAGPPPSVWSKRSDLPFGEEEPGIKNGVRVQGDAFDALLHQPARQIRVVGRTLAADADVLAG